MPNQLNHFTILAIVYCTILAKVNEEKKTSTKPIKTKQDEVWDSINIGILFRRNRNVFFLNELALNTCPYSLSDWVCMPCVFHLLWSRFFFSFWKNSLECCLCFISLIRCFTRRAVEHVWFRLNAILSISNNYQNMTKSKTIFCSSSRCQGILCYELILPLF